MLPVALPLSTPAPNKSSKPRTVRRPSSRGSFHSLLELPRPATAQMSPTASSGPIRGDSGAASSTSRRSNCQSVSPSVAQAILVRSSRAAAAPAPAPAAAATPGRASVPRRLLRLRADAVGSAGLDSQTLPIRFWVYRVYQRRLIINNAYYELPGCMSLYE